MERALPELPGVEHNFVRANGVRMHIAQAGSGEPVFLLHGWPQHWWMWRELIAPLAERYRVIAPDLRGFGWSEAPAGPYDKHRFADDVIALADELHIGSFRLAGHDWGGIAGFELCLRHPERIERDLALNTPHPRTKVDLRSLSTTWRFWYQWLISAPLAGRFAVQSLPVFLRVATNFWTVNREAWSDRDRALFLDQFLERERAEATVRLYRSVALKETPSALRGQGAERRLRVPTLFLHGAGDGALRPPLLRGYEEHADDMTLELVDGCGHFIAEECPELVVRRALAFFAA